MKKIYPLLVFALLLLSSCELSPDISETSSESENTTESSDSISTSETHGEPPEGEYRLNPRKALGDIGYVYDQYGEVIKELSRDEYYTDLEDVAAYVATFQKVPNNYFYTIERDGYSQAKKDCYSLFNDTCRIYPGEYQSNYTYLPHSLDGYYNEADIGDESYAISSSWNRGALRIIFTLKGIQEYGEIVPVVFYTDDHYDNFIEYENYYGGWGDLFGKKGSRWSEIETWF